MRTLIAGIVIVSSALVARAESRVITGHHREPAEPADGGMYFGFAKTSAGVRVDNLALSLKTGPADMRATATFTVATSRRGLNDAAIEIDVPHGAQVTYLKMVTGGAPRIAHLVEAEMASMSYANIVDPGAGDDPAVLEWVGTSTTSDRVRLRIYPLERGKPSNIEVIFTAPLEPQLVVAAGTIPRVTVEIDGARSSWGDRATPMALRLPAPPQAFAAPAEYAHVSTEQSLFIDQPVVDHEIERSTPLPQPRPLIRRAPIRISRACLDNPLASDCM